MNLSKIFKGADSRHIVLPEFQRDFKWSNEKQTNLLASVALGFPIGSILVLNGNKTDFAYRHLGMVDQSIDQEQPECNFLLDGQQRLTTLYYTFTDQFDSSGLSLDNDFDDYLKKIYRKLKKRWFLRLPDFSGDGENLPEDLFGFRDLKFSDEYLGKLEPDEIFGCFQSYSFNESNKQVTAWWSPYYQLRVQNSDGPTYETEFRAGCLENKLIPLFYSNTPNHVLWRPIIASLANDRAKQLLSDNWKDVDFIKSSLKDVDYDGELSGLSCQDDVREKYDVIERIWERKASEWTENVSRYLRGIASSYDVPDIVTNDVSRAIPIFKHLNEGGIRLGDYDLLVAKAAKKINEDDSNYSLGEEIKSVIISPIPLNQALLRHVPTGSRPNSFSPINFQILDDKIPNSAFQALILSTLSLVSYVDYGDLIDDSGEYKLNVGLTKSKQVLKISTENIRKNISSVVKSLCRSFAFLNTRCGVCSLSEVHYRLMIIPIAYIFIDDGFWEDADVHDKVEYWYWSSLMSGNYIFNQNKKSIDDVVNLYRWVLNGIGNPFAARCERVLKDEHFGDRELLTLNRDGEWPAKAVHSAILQYTLSTLPRDFSFDSDVRLLPWEIAETGFSPENRGKIEIQDHHVFPLGQAVDIGQSSSELRRNKNHPLNSPLNRTLISKDANQLISSLPTERYLPELGGAGLAEVIANSHFLPSIAQYSGNKDLDFYKGLLEGRFEKLFVGIRTELANLVEGLK